MSQKAPPTVDAATRNGWLRLDDAGLLAQCDEEGYRSRGPGGQRRNKVETAARVRHRPTGLEAHAAETRRREENRHRALQRLRERIAIEVRAPYEEPPELAEYRRGKQLSINIRNPAYPVVLAAVLDALAEADGSYAGAAKKLATTTSQLLKFLKSDREAWRSLSEGRPEA
ncbi:MAG TPA: peptide chain release factor-like protein [Dehalococcoidia bacterium]